MSNETKSDKKYNMTVAGLYGSKAGNLYSLTLDARNMDAISTMTEGGKIFIRFLSDETKDKITAKGKKAVDAFLEYKDAETVAREDDEYRTSRVHIGPGGTDAI